MIEFICSDCGRHVFLQHSRKRVFCACGGVSFNQRHNDVCTTFGPGDAMAEITNELGLAEKSDCSCKSLRRKMNELGIEGCERQRDWIVQQLEANAAKWSWLEKLQIAASNVTNPLALAIAFRGNIYHALLDEAIARAKRQHVA